MRIYQVQARILSYSLLQKNNAENGLNGEENVFLHAGQKKRCRTFLMSSPSSQMSFTYGQLISINSQNEDGVDVDEILEDGLGQRGKANS